MRSDPTPIHPHSHTPILCLLLLILGGCGASGPALSVTSLQSHQRYVETFTRAYAMRDPAGDYEVVLLNDPIDQASPDEPGQPLSPMPTPPIRQVLQIHLLWQPMAGAKPNSPAATNASLHWYVMGSPENHEVDFIHYQGTAFVAVARHGDEARVTIRNGSLKNAGHRGELNDPLKSFRMEGTFDAVIDAAAVRRAQADVQALMEDTHAVGSLAIGISSE